VHAVSGSCVVGPGGRTGLKASGAFSASMNCCNFRAFSASLFCAFSASSAAARSASPSLLFCSSFLAASLAASDACALAILASILAWICSKG